MGPMDFVNLAGAVVELQKIVAGVKQDVADLKTGKGVETLAPEVAGQVSELASDAQAAATALGVGGGLAGSLLGLLGGVAREVESVFQPAQTAPAPTVVPGAAQTPSVP